MACHFCITSSPIDYKDAQTMRRFMSGQAKISKKRKTKTCAKHQRELSQAIKRARFLGLVPYVLH
ncbi:MAG: 30S ribosomal protein S18 [Candidatus Sungbacteria bacterium RIFCSPLOWO2_12_FULL_41_11]|uniref:Small ribosomal subunit protein bS18 n=1 Tax=Candidatus Sungbacteria bacterium RIFCSPLOWO2_12_FULL_41_11 TaxID=1802286 RepID=A0A1G2LS86_9BACT|nr:MAG: 30S ribosomal protein S18 [Candidatus Sungbacteria bacterium RIFCSPHIGHO2_02_FULL_41_12b]OHA14486.1 MAG: 30S ribosomal protein S18 [Candidatus Sungbacteria bacterium RIFCSPLOWO2_12_FULL_41_11]